MVGRMCMTTLCLLLAGSLSSQGTTGTPLGNWRDIRGTNYVTATATARDNVRMWLSAAPGPGHFDPNLVQAELRFLAGQGLNSVRIFGSFYAYVADPKDYLRNLATLLRFCRQYRFYVTVVVWDCFGRDDLATALLGETEDLRWLIQSRITATHQRIRAGQPTLPPGWGGTWFASPGNRLLAQVRDPARFPPGVRSWMDAYLDQLGQVFGGSYRDVFLSYDLINEPDNLVLLGLRLNDSLTVAEKLVRYSAVRLLWRHPQARFTVALGSPTRAVQLHQRLKQRYGAGLHYLSYHDYLRAEGCDQRALLAAVLAQQEGLEAVCSEFYTAARQGHLRELLDALDRYGIGGQLWGALEDRIFVVRYDDAFRPLYPRSPSKWWVRDTGLFRPVRDPQVPGGWRFQAKNTAYAQALRTWARKQDPSGFPWPALHVTPLGPETYRVEVTGPVGWPVRLLAGAASTPLIELPGFGLPVLQTAQTTWLGALQPTAQPGVGKLTVILPRPPRTAEAAGLAFQAIVGNDYQLASWEQSHRTLPTPIVRVR